MGRRSSQRTTMSWNVNCDRTRAQVTALLHQAVNAGGFTRLTHHSLHMPRQAKSSHLFTAPAAVSNLALGPSPNPETLTTVRSSFGWHLLCNWCDVASHFAAKHNRNAKKVMIDFDSQRLPACLQDLCSTLWHSQGGKTKGEWPTTRTPFD